MYGVKWNDILRNQTHGLDQLPSMIRRITLRQFGAKFVGRLQSFWRHVRLDYLAQGQQLGCSRAWWLQHGRCTKDSRCAWIDLRKCCICTCCSATSTIHGVAQSRLRSRDDFSTNLVYFPIFYWLTFRSCNSRWFSTIPWKPNFRNTLYVLINYILSHDSQQIWSDQACWIYWY